MSKHAHIAAARGGRRAAAALAASAALALTIGASVAAADDAAGPDPSPVPETAETETAPVATAEPEPEPVAEESPAEPEPAAEAEKPAALMPVAEEPAAGEVAAVAVDVPEIPGPVDEPAITQGSSPEPASVTSDAVNYAPGETITLRGAGWPADQALTVTLRELETVILTLDVRADAGGSFTAEVTLDRFSMVIVAEVSGTTGEASTTFGVYEGSS